MNISSMDFRLVYNIPNGCASCDFNKRNPSFDPDSNKNYCLLAMDVIYDYILREENLSLYDCKILKDV